MYVIAYSNVDSVSNIDDKKSDQLCQLINCDLTKKI